MQLSIPYFTVLVILGIISQGVSNYVEDTDDSYKFNRNDNQSRNVILICTIVLISFYAFREISAQSVDESIYRNRFIRFTGMSLQQVFSQTTEYIFDGFIWVTSRITQNSQIMLASTGTITAFLYLKAIKKYCYRYSYGLICLLLTGSVFYSFNGIQQSLAASVFLLSLDYIENRDFKKFIPILVFCFFIHNASAFLIVFYIIGRSKFKSFRCFFYVLLLFVGIILVYRRLPEIIQQTGVMTQYYDKLFEGHHGVKLLRIVVNVIPCVLGLLLPASLYSNDKKLNILAIISAIHAILYIASYIDVYIARFALFSMPATAVFLSNIVEYFDESSRKMLKIGIIVFYSIFMVLDMRGYIYHFRWLIG